MIKLDNHTNIQFLENSYLSFAADTAVDLQISKNIASIEFGLMPAIIQFIATWHEKNKNGNIILNIIIEQEYDHLNNEELIELSTKLIGVFYKLDFLYPSVVYCWDRKIVDKKGKDLKPLLRLQNEIMHTKMKRQSGGGGNKYLLSCFDHLSTQKGLLNAFYISEEFISNELTFDYAIDKSLKQVLSLNHSLRKNNFTPNHQDIIGIIYELMKNTHDWARTDFQNKPLKSSTRGLFMKLHRQKRDTYIKEFEKQESLKNYFSETNFRSTSSDELYFLELSVFDTGIGFVNRFTGKSPDQLSATDQISIIKECLIVNNTSATGLEKISKGKGLDRIMRILSTKGLFWLRTGNISVFRNLIDNKYNEDPHSSTIQLYDWFKNSTSEISHLANAKGSVVTLVYPITNMSNV